MVFARFFMLFPVAPLGLMVVGGTFRRSMRSRILRLPSPRRSNRRLRTAHVRLMRLIAWFSSDMELSALDRTLARLLIDLPPQSEGSEHLWMEGQQAWFKRRSLCAFDKNHIECTRSAYIIRIAELGAITSDANDDKPLRCPTFPAASRYSISAQGLMVVRDADGEVLIAAWPKDQKGWRPFVSYRWKRTKGRLTRLGDDATLTCRSG